MSALSCAPAIRPSAEIALYGKTSQNADFPANGAAGFSYGVRLYRKQFLSVYPEKMPQPGLARLAQADVLLLELLQALRLVDLQTRLCSAP